MRQRKVPEAGVPVSKPLTMREKRAVIRLAALMSSPDPDFTGDEGLYWYGCEDYPWSCDKKRGRCLMKIARERVNQKQASK